MSVDLSLARSRADMEAVYRLRYDVYVVEQGRSQRFVDHENGWIEEPLDRRGLVWIARDGDRTVGTVRVNYARDGGLGYYEKLYGMASCGDDHPRRTSMTTKMVTAKSHRNALLGSRLACAAFFRARADGIVFDFVDVFEARIPFFERFGYVVQSRVVHPEYGDVAVLRLDLCDLEHLRRVRSPFLRIPDTADGTFIEEPSPLLAADGDPIQ